MTLNIWQYQGTSDDSSIYATMFPSSVEQIEPAPKHPLKKLLDRIRSQRNQWIEHETAEDLPTVITDEIPEKDTTTDTG